MLAVRMKEDATKKRKLEERARKRKQAEEVQSKKAEEVGQPKLKTKYGRESRQPKESYEPATKRRIRPMTVKCDILLRSYATIESPILTFTLASS